MMKSVVHSAWVVMEVVMMVIVVVNDCIDCYVMLLI